MSSEQPIGVFDSGIGGLSVVRHIRSLLPSEDILYVSDAAHAPYGVRSADWIIDRSRTITRYLIDQGAKAIVIACNTATAAAVESLRQEFDLPIVAMEPAVKPAAEATSSGVIGVLATAGTIESERYAALLKRHGASVKVLNRICHHWVEQVESGVLDGASVEAMVRADVEPLIRAGADTLVLGCTHFPLLLPVIRQVVGDAVHIIDPAPAVAVRLKTVLTEHDLLHPGTRPGGMKIVTSRSLDKHHANLQQLLDEALDLAFLPNL